MPTSFHDIDGWSFLVGYASAYVTAAIAALVAFSFLPKKGSYNDHT